MTKKADNYFAIIPHWVLFSKISAQAVRLYCALRTYADNKTNESWPSRPTLAKDMQVDSVKTVDRAIKELIEIGALKVEKRFYDKQQQTNLYILMSLPPSDMGVPTQPQESPTNYNHITITNNGDKSPQMQVRDLMKLYFENFLGDLEPARGQVAGQLQEALKRIPYEKLEPLVIAVARDGQVVSRNTLVFAQSRLKPAPATPTPPKFDPTEYEKPDAVPMPTGFKDMVFKASKAVLSDLQSKNDPE